MSVQLLVGDWSHSNPEVVGKRERECFTAHRKKQFKSLRMHLILPQSHVMSTSSSLHLASSELVVKTVFLDNERRQIKKHRKSEILNHLYVSKSICTFFSSLATGSRHLGYTVYHITSSWCPKCLQDTLSINQKSAAQNLSLNKDTFSLLDEKYFIKTAWQLTAECRV